MAKMSLSNALMLGMLIFVSINTLMASPENWQKKVYPSMSNDFNVIDYIDKNIVWIASEDDYAVKSENGGIDFQVASMPFTYERVDMCFLNKDTGCVIQSPGYLARTTDGGQNWTTTRISQYWIISITSSDSKTLWITGEYNQILKSTDAGFTWTIAKEISFRDSHDIFFVDGTTGWVVGDCGILKTDNGGADWLLIENTGTYGFKSIQFVDKNTGWAVSDGSGVFKTTDGGKTWSHRNVGEFDFRIKFHMVDSQCGWAIGDGNNSEAIYSTTDGGDTWELEIEVENTTLNCIDFFDRAHGLIAGWETVSLGVSQNVIYRYNNEDITLPATISADCPDRKLDFDLSNTQNKSITISNTGGEPLIISNIELQNSQSSSFDISNEISFPLEVSPGSAVQLSISFTSPGNGDEQNAIVKIHSNAANAPIFEITLSASQVNSVISDIILNGFELFPNPASDFITIKTNYHNNNTIPDNLSLKIYNILGELVKEVKSISESQDIFIDDLPTGVYYLKIGSHCSFFIKD